MDNLFENISNSGRQKLLKMFKATTLVFTKNITILKEIKDNIIGIILDGSVQIINIDYDGNKTIIEDLEKGALFGTNISSLTNQERYMITKEQTTILLIEYENILNNDFYSNPYYITFLKNLLAITNNIIEEKNNHIEILTKKSIREKLLNYFTLMSKKQKTKYLYLPFSLSELADYLSINRSSMMREIKLLKEDGLIEGKGKRIHIIY